MHVHAYLFGDGCFAEGLLEDPLGLLIQLPLVGPLDWDGTNLRETRNDTR